MNFLKRKKIYCNGAKYSLLFQPSGEIIPCHYNRGYILGKYPDDKIIEVWKSKTRKSLLRSVENAEFNLGCFSCKSDYESNLPLSAGFTKYNYIKKNSNNYPSLMEFQTGNTCNLECIMCSGEYSSLIRKNIEQLNPYNDPYGDDFVEELKEFIPHLNHISFTGGEPFLIKLYYKIWDVIKELNPDLNIYVSTNGTILNDKIEKYLDSLNFNFAISLDSINKETYEKIRRNAKLDVTMKNINYFIDYCNKKNTELTIKTIVIPQNYKYVPDLLNYFGSKDVDVLPKLVFVPYYASFKSSTEAELKKILETFKNHDYITNTPKAKSNFNKFNELIIQIEKIAENKNDFFDDLLKNKDLDSLKALFTNQIVENSEKIDAHIAKPKDFYLKEIEKLFNSVTDETRLKSAVLNFLRIPPEILINEFNRLDSQKLIARFRQASFFTQI